MSSSNAARRCTALSINGRIELCILDTMLSDSKMGGVCSAVVSWIIDIYGRLSHNAAAIAPGACTTKSHSYLKGMQRHF